MAANINVGIRGKRQQVFERQLGSGGAVIFCSDRRKSSPSSSRSQCRQEVHLLDRIAVSWQLDEMSEISADDSVCGVHLRRCERIYGDDGTLGFRRSHIMVRFVVPSMALVASGKDVMEDHLGPGSGLFKRQMGVGT